MANIQVNFKNNYLLISVLLKPMVFDATELIIIHTSNSMGKHVTKDWYYIVCTSVHYTNRSPPAINLRDFWREHCNRERLYL